MEICTVVNYGANLVRYIREGRTMDIELELGNQDIMKEHLEDTAKSYFKIRKPKVRRTDHEVTREFEG
jgi:hypothetical protein